MHHTINVQEHMPQGEFIQAEEAAHHHQENEDGYPHVRVDVHEEDSRGVSDSSATPGQTSSYVGERRSQEILHSQERYR